jgi:branched-chain amino acid transport system ATP-binding protein
LGATARFRRGARVRTDEDMDRVFALFPRLKERVNQLAGTLSGGEQQMLALGRALMARPKLILLDEPSMGLAPLLVKEIFVVIRRLRDEGNTVLLVEQNARAALKIANRGYVLENGRIILEASAEALLANRDVERAYLGRDLDAEAAMDTGR